MFKSIYMGALLFVVPFLFFLPVGDDPIRTSKVAGVILFAAFPIAALVWQRIRPSIALLLFWIIVNAVISGMGPIQLSNLAYIGFTFCALIPLIGSHERDVIKATKWLSYAGFCMSLYAIYQWLKLPDPFFKYIDAWNVGTPVGTFGQQTVLGPFLAAAVCAALFTRGYLVASVITFACLLTKSSFTYLSLFTVCVFFLSTKLPKRVMVAVLAAPIVAVLSAIAYQKYSGVGVEFLMDNNRSDLWVEIYNLFMRFNVAGQVFGAGIGSFIGIFPQYESTNLFGMSGIFRQAHNEFIQGVFELGLISIPLQLYAVADFARMTWGRRHNKIALCWGGITASMLVNSIGSFPLHLQPHGLLALAGIIVVATMETGLVEY